MTLSAGRNAILPTDFEAAADALCEVAEELLHLIFVVDGAVPWRSSSSTCSDISPLSNDLVFRARTRLSPDMRCLDMCNTGCMVASIVGYRSSVSTIVSTRLALSPEQALRSLLSSINSSSVVLFSRRLLFLWYLLIAASMLQNLLAGLARHSAEYEPMVLVSMAKCEGTTGAG